MLTPENGQSLHHLHPQPLPEIFIHDDDMLESVKNNSSILSNIAVDMLSQSTISRHISKTSNMHEIYESHMENHPHDHTVTQTYNEAHH